MTRLQPQAVDAPRVRTRHIVATVLLLAFVCGDGVATAVQVQRGLDSPYVVLFPLLGTAVALLLFDIGRLPFRLFWWGIAVGIVGSALLLLHLNWFGAVHLLGFAQQWVFLVLLLAVQDLTANATDGMAAALRRGVVGAHYAFCGYLALTLAVWYFTGFDMSVISIVLRVPTEINDYYGFRPSGLNREPAWAGLLLTSTFIGVFMLKSDERLRAFLALVVAIAALRSGTAFAFAGLFVGALLLQRQSGMSMLRAALLGAVAVLALGGVFRDRVDEVIRGADPSGLMRVDSARVGWGVIEESFPLGVGYGNFRDHAEYGPQFSSYVELAKVPDYKTDLVLTNLPAELGVVGLLVIGAFVAVYARGRHLLFWGHLGILLLLTGSFLTPSNMLIAAIIGLQERSRRATSTAAVRAAATLPPGARRPPAWAAELQNRPTSRPF